MRKVATLVCALCLAFPGLAAKRKAHPATRHKPHAATAPKSPKRTVKKSARHSASARHSTKRKTAAGKSSKSAKKRTSWRSGQMAPTPERYRQIQQALADKGYLQGPATGVWGTDSIAALKRFQEDQKLEPSGKLDSLTLITLGLGPRRDLSGANTANINTPSSSVLREPQ